MAEQWGVSVEEYHADFGSISHTMLQVARRSLKEYHSRYVAGSYKPSKQSAALTLGSATHTYLLEHDQFDARYAVLETQDRRNKLARSQIADIVASGRRVLSGDQFSRVQAISRAVWSCPAARPLLEAISHSEFSVRWTGVEGLNLKVRFDALTELHGWPVILDLKTSRTPGLSDFRREVKKYGYDKQAALYTEGYQALSGNEGKHLHLVVGTEPPHDVGVYELGQDTLSKAFYDNREILEKLAECYDSGVWHEDGYGKIQLLEL